MVREDGEGKTAPRGVGLYLACTTGRRLTKRIGNTHASLATMGAFLRGVLLGLRAGWQQSRRVTIKGTKNTKAPWQRASVMAGEVTLPFWIRALVVFLARFRLNECFLQSTACRERFCHAGALAMQQNADLKGYLGKMRADEVTSYVCFWSCCSCDGFVGHYSKTPPAVHGPEHVERKSGHPKLVRHKPERCSCRQFWRGGAAVWPRILSALCQSCRQSLPSRIVVTTGPSRLAA